MEPNEKPRLPQLNQQPKVIHTKLHSDSFAWADNDLARDNLENDLTEADKQNH